MKYIYVVLILGALWCSEGYGAEDWIATGNTSNDEWESIFTEATCRTASASPMYTAKVTGIWHTRNIERLRKQIADLKAEVEELRKMIEKRKQIDGDSWATWPEEVDAAKLEGEYIFDTKSWIYHFNPESGEDELITRRK